MFAEKKALLLDMNGTFMFGEDRFGESEDYSVYYSEIGGTLSSDKINGVIHAVYGSLASKYPDADYRECFPTLKCAIHEVIDENLENDEIDKIINTFAFHELGHIPAEYTSALQKLSQRFMLAAVADIWSPKPVWIKEFEQAGILDLFSTMSFSSDHGMVKPSPKPFNQILNGLALSNSEAVVIGDSVRRDLGGANRAGIDCVLVGGAKHPKALKCFDSLLELCELL